MGYGYTIECEACNYNRRILLGEGMMTPSLAFEELEKMKNGEYGPDVKEVAESENVAICAFYDSYVCPDCGELSGELTPELYQTKNGEPMPQKVVSPADTDGYDLVLELPITCEKCGGTLKKAERLIELPCPLCHGKLKKRGGMIMWD